MMSEKEEVRKEIIKYVQAYYASHKREPSVREIAEEFKGAGVNRYTFYGLFPRGKLEVCRLAGIPVSAERIKQTEEALRARRKAKEKNEGEVYPPAQLVLTEGQTEAPRRKPPRGRKGPADNLGRAARQGRQAPQNLRGFPCRKRSSSGTSWRKPSGGGDPSPQIPTSSTA